MNKFMRKLWAKKDSKKGFTLVELIVVLVILGILMAILIPAMTGWIGKAKEKQVMLNARTVVLAAQSAQSDAYGKPTPVQATEDEVKAYLGDDFPGEWLITVSKTLETVESVVYTDGSTTVTYKGTGTDIGYAPVGDKPSGTTIKTAD